MVKDYGYWTAEERQRRSPALKRDITHHFICGLSFDKLRIDGWRVACLAESRPRREKAGGVYEREGHPAPKRDITHHFCLWLIACPP